MALGNDFIDLGPALGLHVGSAALPHACIGGFQLAI